MATGTSLAIIPGAGHSRRMGQPKLLLPWGGTGRTIVDVVVQTLMDGGVDRVVVVARGSDIVLRNAVARTPAVLFAPPTDPPEMLDSIRAGLVCEQERIAAGAPWFVVPGDHPLFSAQTVRALLNAFSQSDGEADVLVPEYQGRRGHPSLFAPVMAQRVAEIPTGLGLNWLVKRQDTLVKSVPVDDPGILADLDTPEEYARWTDSTGAR